MPADLPHRQGVITEQSQNFQGFLRSLFGNNPAWSRSGFEQYTKSTRESHTYRFPPKCINECTRTRHCELTIPKQDQDDSRFQGQKRSQIQSASHNQEQQKHNLNNFLIHHASAEVMKSLNISRGVRRVLFRTLNTDRKLMFKKEFDSSYVAFMEDGAKWLVENTDIKLVGVDYLSSAAYVNLITPHLIFLKKRKIILVEGLKLDNIIPGHYNVHCLPLRMIGADGSPARCILVK